jgi:VWFA-related protein
MDARKIILLAGVFALATGGTRMAGQSAPSAAPAPANAQEQTPSPANQLEAHNPQTKPNSTVQPLRSTTRLVQVSVIVHDKHGDPIAGLTKDDFVILDDKKPQAIQIFSVQSNEPSKIQAQVLPPDTFTNRMEARGGAPPNVTIILLDALNTSFMDKAFVRKRLVKYLQTIQPQDRIALYVLGSHLRVLHDFTSDASSLLASLQKFKDDSAPEIDLSGLDLSGNPYKKLGGMSDDVERMQGAQDIVQITVEALREIANHVGALPGRKNLIWLSGSFPFSISPASLRTGVYGQPIVFSTQIEMAARALSDANVAIYPVDARGLIDLGPDSLNVGVGGNPFRVPTTDESGTMQVLADRTGGRAYFNTNDIMGSIRQAIDDSRITYELGFVPEGIKWDGSFHKIHVTVNRPDAQLRARKGYFALAEPKEAPLTHLQLIAQTAMSPMEATGIEMNVQVTPGEAEQGNTLKMELAFDMDQFGFQHDNGYWIGAVDTAFVELDESGKIVASTVQPFPLHLDTETYQRLLKQGLTYTNEMLMVPGAVQVRVILRDAATGKIGSVGIPLADYFPAKSN